MPQLFDRLKKIATRAKEAWEWLTLMATLGLVPIAATRVLEGQTWDVILLYVMAAIAYWFILVAEGRPILEALRKRRLEFDFLPECCAREYPRDRDHIISVGVRSKGSATVRNALVRIDVPHINVRGRLLAWHGHNLGAALQIDPPPTPEFHYHVGLAQTVNSGTSLEMLFVGPESRHLSPGDYRIVLTVTGEDTATAVAATVSLSQDGHLSLLPLREPAMVGWVRREV